jgi:hypothetical protein
LVKVRESLVDPQTQRRETAAINEATIGQSRSTATIVTRYEEKLSEVDVGSIRAISVWRFLLELARSTG